MKNWKTTLGGSLSALGTVLMGAGVVPSLTSMTAAENLKWLVISGFVLQALGGFFANLFAADRASVPKEKENNETTP